MELYKMFSLIKKVVALVLMSTEFFLTNSAKCISLKKQEWKVTEVVINNEYMTYPYDIKLNICNGNCNNITNPYSRVCIPDIIKNVTVKIFDLISQQNKIKQMIFHESCKCVCRLNPIFCNNKQKRNKNKCRCEYLVDKNWGNNFSIPNNCECEYKKSSKINSRRKM